MTPSNGCSAGPNCRRQTGRGPPASDPGFPYAADAWLGPAPTNAFPAFAEPAIDVAVLPELSESEVSELRAVSVDTGALEQVEALIDLRLAEAMDALDSAPVTPAAAAALRELAVAATARAA